MTLNYKILFQYLLFLFIINIYNLGYSQTFLKGKVVDAITEKPLAFVNITFNNEKKLGTATDINGEFIINPESSMESLVFSYVGYISRKVTIEKLRESETIFKLEPMPVFLNEVVIHPKDNPANQIIERVIRNKDNNNPEKMHSFSYQSYSHNIYELNPNKHLINSRKVIDSTLSRLISFSEKMYILIMESVSERKFIYPDKSHENVIATKVSGFSNPTFTSLATDYQPFSFYDDVLSILDKYYTNPISENSYRKYSFNIEDTLFTEADTIFVISFKPKLNKNFDALTGLLYINTNKYAIQNVIAKPSEDGLINIKIEQMYSFIDSQQWFPVQLNFEIIFKYYPRKEMGMRIIGKNYINNIKLNPELEERDFALEAITIEDSATKKDSIFWERYRIAPLTLKEVTTYNIVDSFGDKYKIDKIYKSLEKVNIGIVAIGFLNLELNKIYAFNETEGSRFGLGLYTNNNISKYFSIGGYFGYGFNDDKWKYGSSLTMFLNRENDVELKFAYKNDVIEPARSTIKYSSEMFDIIDYMAKNIDYVQEKKASLRFRSFKYAMFDLSLSQNQKKVGYNYYYFPESNSLDSFNVFNFTELNVRVRYAYKEKLIQSLGQRIAISSNYPVFYFSYVRGFKNFLDGENEYNKYEVGVYKKFYLKSLGKTIIRLESGYVDDNVPYNILFTSRASYNKSIPVFVEKTFQTMRFNEFLSNKYLHIFFIHDFGHLLFKTKRFKPEISLIQNIGFGDLDYTQNHKIEYKTMRNGLYETGILIDNILRINTFNLGYFGFGGGVFCRYGPYLFEDIYDNFTFKFSFSFSSN